MAKKKPRKKPNAPLRSAKRAPAKRAAAKPLQRAKRGPAPKSTSRQRLIAKTDHEPRSQVPAPPESPAFLVAGVGASAGGLEAFGNMLKAMPADAPLALILVQHLARAQQSLLPELLASKTPLKVLEARDDLPITRGTVYVIRPDTSMTVIDGRLRVRQMPRQQRGIDGPIDRLFESLAQQYREKAVGVVLSGSGHDGAAGLVEIKAAGGVTIAQDPQEAGVDGMPRSAIATGTVEFVLPAEKIASELVQLAVHPFFRQLDGGDHDAREGDDDRTHPPPSEATQLAPIFQSLRRVTGVDFSQYKLPTLSRRIHRRMALHRVSDLASYAELLKKNAEEVENLHDDVLIHVTGFFREAESFDVLRELIFPKIFAARTAGVPIRAWVPGCSSGEEAYSLAIALLEFLDDQADNVPIQVFGTDVSHKMIDRARVGAYPESIASRLTPEQLRRFFVRVEGGYRVSATTRERCVFARQDITHDPPFSRLDIVLCRNLLIYLTAKVQRKLIGVLHYALNPSGYLVLGRSETIGAHSDLFSIADNRWKIYQRKPGSAAPRELEFPARPHMPRQEAMPPLTPAKPPIKGHDPDVQAEANRMLLERFAPPLVIVNDDFKIVRSRGATGTFFELPSGEASLDALKMARPGLLSGLRSALQEARARGVASRRERLRLRVNGDWRMVDLEVTPLGTPDNRHYVVLFEDDAAPARRRKASSAADKPRPVKREIPAVEQLHEELAATRQHLQSNIQDLEATNEELQSANEEILSSNEELQSTNEELDTAREELQSTNEELSTVNEELQTRNVELARANSDLLNLLASVQIPIVMVSPDLKIRRFTPAAERTLNLIAADVGRPIGHIRPNVEIPDLEKIVREVVDTITTQEREVTDPSGATYLLSVRPYKNVQNMIDGAVVTLFDVTMTTKVARETAESVISSVREPILLLSPDHRVQRANRAFCEKFRVSAKETEGHSLFELGNRQWDIPALHKLLNEILPERKNFEGFVVDHDFPAIGAKKMLLDGRRIDSGRPGVGAILLVIRDMTP